MVSLSMGAERNEDGRRSEDCVDILPSVNGGDSYSSQAHDGTRVASVGSCHDALAAGEGCEQANKANPASLIFTAPTKSALAENPHSTQTNFACVLLLCAGTPDTYGWCSVAARTREARRAIASCTPTADPTRTDWRPGWSGSARTSG